MTDGKKKYSDYLKERDAPDSYKKEHPILREAPDFTRNKYFQDVETMTYGLDETEGQTNYPVDNSLTPVQTPKFDLSIPEGIKNRITKPNIQNVVTDLLGLNQPTGIKNIIDASREGRTNEELTLNEARRKKIKVDPITSGIVKGAIEPVTGALDLLGRGSSELGTGLQEFGTTGNFDKLGRSGLDIVQGLLHTAFTPFTVPFGAVTGGLNASGQIGNDISTGLNRTMNIPFDLVGKGSELTGNVLGINGEVLVSPEFDKQANELATELLGLILLGKSHQGVKKFNERMQPVPNLIGKQPEGLKQTLNVNPEQVNKKTGFTNFQFEPKPNLTRPVEGVTQEKLPLELLKENPEIINLLKGKENVQEQSPTGVPIQPETGISEGVRKKDTETGLQKPTKTRVETKQVKNDRQTQTNVEDVVGQITNPEKKLIKQTFGSKFQELSKPEQENILKIKSESKDYQEFKTKLSSKPPAERIDQGKDDIIDRIVKVSEKPIPNIESVQELKGANGKWYSPLAIPFGLKTTGETRLVGYTYVDRNGSGFGSLKKTKQELIDDWNRTQKIQKDKFKEDLSNMNEEDFQNNVNYWLKEESKPEQTGFNQPQKKESSSEEVQLDELKNKKYKSSNDEIMIKILEKRINTPADKYKVGDGVFYKVAAGGKDSGARRGFRIIEIDKKNKEAVIEQVADTGLTSSGGDYDKLGRQRIHLGDLYRDKKYDKPPDVPRETKDTRTQLTKEAIEKVGLSNFQKYAQEYIDKNKSRKNLPEDENLANAFLVEEFRNRIIGEDPQFVKDYPALFKTQLKPESIEPVKTPVKVETPKSEPNVDKPKGETPDQFPQVEKKVEIPRKISAKDEFKVGDVIETSEGLKQTIREIKGNSIYFTDENGQDYSGFSRSTLRNLVNGGSWKRVETQQPKVEKQPYELSVEELDNTLKKIEDRWSNTEYEVKDWERKFVDEFNRLKKKTSSEVLPDLDATTEMRKRFPNADVYRGFYRNAIKEGKIDSHPDYPELSKPVSKDVTPDNNKTEAFRMFGEGKKDKDIAVALGMKSRAGLDQVREWKKEYKENQNKDVKIKTSFDSFKVNKAPYIMEEKTSERGFSYDKKVYLPESYEEPYMFKSDETGHKVRWGVELSDGRKVSVDGSIRITNPKLWERIQNQPRDKKFNSIWKAFKPEEQLQILSSLDWDAINKEASNYIAKKKNDPNSYHYYRHNDLFDQAITDYLYDVEHPFRQVFADKGVIGGLKNQQIINYAHNKYVEWSRTETQVKPSKPETKNKVIGEEKPTPKVTTKKSARISESLDEALLDYLVQGGSIKTTKTLPKSSLEAMGIPKNRISETKGANPETIFSSIAPHLENKYLGEAQSQIFEDILLKYNSHESRVEGLKKLRGELTTKEKEAIKRAVEDHQRLDEVILNEYLDTDGNLRTNDILKDVEDISRKANVDEDIIFEYLQDKQREVYEPEKFDDVFGEIFNIEDIKNERAKEIVNDSSPAELEKLASDIESKKGIAENLSDKEIESAINKADELILTPPETKTKQKNQQLGLDINAEVKFKGSEDYLEKKGQGEDTTPLFNQPQEVKGQENLFTEPKPEPTKSEPKPLAEQSKEVKRIVSEEAYKKAKENLGDPKKINLKGGLGTVEGAKVLKDLTTVGAYHFENGLRKFGDWSKRMIAEYGEGIKKRLKQIWDNARAEYDKVNLELSDPEKTIYDLKQKVKKYDTVEDFAKDYEILYHGGSEKIIGNKLATNARVVGEITKDNLGKGQDYGGIFFTPEKSFAETFSKHSTTGSGKVHSFIVEKKNLFDANNPSHIAKIKNFVGKEFRNIDGDLETFTKNHFDFMFVKDDAGKLQTDWATFDPQLLEQLGFKGAKIVEKYEPNGKHLYSTVLFEGGIESPHWMIPEGTTLKSFYNEAPFVSQRNRVISYDGYEQAKQNIKQKNIESLNKLGSGLGKLDPSLLKDYAVIGAYHLETVVRAGIKTGTEFRNWAKEMIADLGESIKPHLKAIWAEVAKDKDLAETLKPYRKEIPVKEIVEPVKIETVKKEVVTPEKPKKVETDFGSGEVRTRGLAASVEARSIAKGITDGIENLPTYKVEHNLPKIDEASKIIAENPERALDIIEGKEFLDKKDMEGFLTIGLEDYAVRNDPKLLIRIAKAEFTSEKATEYGRFLQSLRDQNPLSPRKAIRDIIEARQESSAFKRQDKLKTEYESKIKDLEEKLKLKDEALESIEAEKSYKKLQRETKIEQRREKRNYTRQELKLERDDLYKDLAKTFTVNVGFTADQVIILGKLTKNYAREGILSAEAVVDAIYNQIADKLEGVTKKDIRDAISGYGREVKTRTKDELQTAMNDLRQQMKTISRIEELESGKIPVKKEVKRTEPSEELSNLRSELKTVLDEHGITDYTNLEKAKKMLKNKIVEYHDKINSGDYSKQKREPILDEERTKLQKELDDIRDKWKYVQKTLGEVISEPEAKQIAELSKKAMDAKTKAEGMPRRIDNGKPTKEELEWGAADYDFIEYVEGLKHDAGRTTWADIKEHPFQKIGEGTVNVIKASKEIVSAFDASFIGRQGLKTLFTGDMSDLITAIPRHLFDVGRKDIPRYIWGKTFAKNLELAIKTFGGKNVMKAIHAEIVSDPLYPVMKKAKVALATIEEAFPLQLKSVGKAVKWGTSLEGNIPSIIGREIVTSPLTALKASENAFVGSAYYMRYKLAQRLLTIAKDSNVDLNNQFQVESIGRLVNDLTARGKIGKEDRKPGIVNAIIWSPKMIMGHLNVLTAPFRPGEYSSFARKQASYNLLKIVAGMGAINTIANIVSPGSAERNPLSSNWGKIKVGNTTFDYTGGLASIVTLAARLTPLITHLIPGVENKKPMYKNYEGEIVEINSQKYGSMNGMDLLYNFLENKTSPAASEVITHLKGVTRDKEIPTVSKSIVNMYTPFPYKTGKELMDDPNSAPIVASMILDGFGVSTNTYSNDPNLRRVQNDILISGEEKFSSVKRGNFYRALKQALKDNVITKSQYDNYKTNFEESQAKFGSEKQKIIFGK